MYLKPVEGSLIHDAQTVLRYFSALVKLPELYVTNQFLIIEYLQRYPRLIGFDLKNLISLYTQYGSTGRVLVVDRCITHQTGRMTVHLKPETGAFSRIWLHLV
jgi:hypothetical protein